MLIVSSAALQDNTTVVLGHAERDLTGDGQPEILRVVGVGPTMDDLGVTFTIESGGRTIFRSDMGRMRRTVGYDASRQVLSPQQHRDRIEAFGAWFFDTKKFEPPAAFVESLRRMSRLAVAEIPRVIERDRDVSDPVAGSVIWQEIYSAPVTIFWFSPGGDRVEAIGWNARAQRFYRLLECC
jgi:hypothetical protein